MMDDGALTTIFVVTATATALCAALDSWWWRRGDPLLRHTLWAALVLASLACPMLAVLSPDVIRVPIAAAAGGSDAARLSWLHVLGSIYAMGLGVLLIRLLLGLFLIKRLIASAQLLTPGDHARLLRLCGPAVALRCRVHRRLQSPVTAAWRESFVLLPAASFDWPDARLRAVVEHEWAHVCRSDFWWNLAAGVHRAVYWPSPLAWLVVRRLQMTAELASDLRASHVVGSTDFARILVESAHDLTRAHDRFSRLAPGAATDLVTRIDALLSESSRRHSSSASARRLAAGVVVIVMMIAMLVRFTPATTATTSGGPAIGSNVAVDGNHEARHATRHRH